MTFEERAQLIWQYVEGDLADRGCFNGIDDEVMAELRQSQIDCIATLLGKPITTTP